MARTAIYTPEERKERDKANRKKWFYNKYHTDPEFKERFLSKKRKQ